MSAKDMLDGLARKLKILPVPVLKIVGDLLEKLSDPNWVEATTRFLRKENPWPLTQSNLLSFIKEVKLPAISNPVPESFFGKYSIKGVRIGSIGEDFKNEFLSGDSAVESDIAESTIRMYHLATGATDQWIIAQLGGEKSAEITLPQLWAILREEEHEHRKNILVQNRGYDNIFYIRDTKGVLWIIECCWYSHDFYWHVWGKPISNEIRWHASGLVFAPDVSGS